MKKYMLMEKKDVNLFILKDIMGTIKQNEIMCSILKKKAEYK
jgi:hypothetical protein